MKFRSRYWRKIIQASSIALFFTLLFVACKDEADDNNDSKREVTLVLKYDTTLKKMLYVADSETGKLTLSEFEDEDGSFDFKPEKLRLTVAAINPENGEIATEIQELCELNGDYTDRITLTVPSGSLDVYLWADFPSEITAGYNLDRFPVVRTSSGKYSGDAFKGNGKIPETADGEIEIEMSRPVGALCFIDTSKDLSREESGYSVEISYPWYFPTAFSLDEDRVTDSETGIFREKTYMKGNILGGDFMFINSIEGGVNVVFSIFDAEDSRLFESQLFEVPMKRGILAVVKGDFLSPLEDDGGFGLDPGFDGDITYTPE